MEETFREFAAFAGKLKGDEKSEAQTFLLNLLKTFGHDGKLPAGASFEYRVKFPDGHTKYADFAWPGNTVIEMKSRGENLLKHYGQAKDYWWNLYPNRPRYVVLCNFDEFRIYDFETQPDTPKDILLTKDLAERWGPLAFLYGDQRTPVFGNDHEGVTRAAAGKFGKLYRGLVKRGTAPALAQRFILQMLVALFAEDIGLLPKYFVAQLLDDCGSPAEAYDLLGGLFKAMNTNPAVSGGRFKGVRYFNGGIFAQPASVELTDSEIVAVREIAKADWSKVQPEIFGTLFEQTVSDPDAAVDERRAFGQHFTSPADIMKIVKPTIVEPWTEQIESAKTLKRLGELRERLHHFRVLDPACGSGNFLYIAYRELKRLEARIVDRINTEFPSRAEPDQRQLSYLSAQNFFGLDINSMAIDLAKVTMMIGRKLAIDELHISERDLPLDNLDQNFVVCDALFTDWPKVDVIIGNPPFIGAKLLKPQRGPDYVKQVREKFPAVPGMADYCVYWIRKAHDHLPACTAADPVAGRAGLVGTQNIRNNQSRVGGLDYVVKTGTIIEAVENQPWSGEANVHVSIANWVKTQDAGILPKTRRLWFKVEPSPGVKKLRKRGTGLASKVYELDCRECAVINSAISDQTDVAGAIVLKCNIEPPSIYNGQFPRHHGFVLEPTEAGKLIAKDPANREVVHPFLIGAEMLVHGAPQRWVIDFQKMNLLEARRYEAPFRHVEQTVLPHISGMAGTERTKSGKDTGQDQQWLKTWWQHFRCRKELIDAAAKLPRYLACCEVTKRPIFCFINPDIRPDHTLEAFVLPDDYSFGILQSSAHWLWFITKCSKFKSDFRYTPASVYDTFPWPQTATAKQIAAVADAGRAVRRVRAAALTNLKGGLRALYRTLELPGENPLKDAHAALDAAVLTAYGFSPKKDLLAQLLALNLAVAGQIAKGEKVTAAGIPKDYPKPKELVTGDCIQPTP